MRALSVAIILPCPIAVACRTWNAFWKVSVLGLLLWEDNVGSAFQNVCDDRPIAVACRTLSLSVARARADPSAARARNITTCSCFSKNKLSIIILLLSHITEMYM